MENKTEIIRKIIYSRRNNHSSLNELYSSPSTMQNKPNEVGISCKEVFYVVEWQMQHNELDFTQKYKFANE